MFSNIFSSYPISSAKSMRFLLSLFFLYLSPLSLPLNLFLLISPPLSLRLLSLTSFISSPLRSSLRLSSPLRILSHPLLSSSSPIFLFLPPLSSLNRVPLRSLPPGFSFSATFACPDKSRTEIVRVRAYGLTGRNGSASGHAPQQRRSCATTR